MFLYAFPFYTLFIHFLLLNTQKAMAVNNKLIWEEKPNKILKLSLGINTLCIIGLMSNGKIYIWSKPLKNLGIHVKARKSDTIYTIKERVRTQLLEATKNIVEQL